MTIAKVNGLGPEKPWNLFFGGVLLFYGAVAGNNGIGSKAKCL
jgi:hypothetical protein